MRSRCLSLRCVRQVLNLAAATARFRAPTQVCERAGKTAAGDHRLDQQLALAVQREQEQRQQAEVVEAQRLQVFAPGLRELVPRKQQESRLEEPREQLRLRQELQLV